jgi:hypothetical protein
LRSWEVPTGHSEVPRTRLLSISVKKALSVEPY